MVLINKKHKQLTSSVTPHWFRLRLQKHRREFALSNMEKISSKNLGQAMRSLMNSNGRKCINVKCERRSQRDAGGSTAQPLASQALFTLYGFPPIVCFLCFLGHDYITW